MQKNNYFKKINIKYKYAVIDEENNIIDKFRLKNTADNSIGRFIIELGFNIKLKVVVLKENGTI